MFINLGSYSCIPPENLLHRGTWKSNVSPQSWWFKQVRNLMYRYLDHHHLLLSDPYHQPIQIFTVCVCHVPKTSSGPPYNLHGIGTWINCWCLLFWSKVHLVHARIKSQIYHAHQENFKWSYCYISKKKKRYSTCNIVINHEDIQPMQAMFLQ